MYFREGFKLLFFSLLAFGCFIFAGSASAQYSQQGTKLKGTGRVPVLGTLVYEATSVALSSDGNTAVLGGTRDNADVGATWVFTRSAGVWSQQGSKLVGSGVAASKAGQGASAALSSDGNTLVVGGYEDNNGIGAAWVFTRSGSTWSQQGTKLVGTGAIGVTNQGLSVAISGDGNTIMVGGPFDNSNIGAVWVYTRSGSTWSQQGNKIVGSGGSSAMQGSSVALSFDGNTAVVGGVGDNGGIGATWIFTRSAGVWRQQGTKLVGTGYTGNGNQGSSVSVSSDGNTAITGAHIDNGAAGAMWVFTRTDTVWHQQGGKLVGTGAVGIAEQGITVSLSGDGNTAVEGGYRDNGYVGAAWVFTRTDTVWSQKGTKLIGTGATGNAFQGKSIAISADATTLIVGGPLDSSGIGAAWVYLGSGTTDVRDAGGMPAGFRLDQNFPNPFNPASTIRFSITNASFTSLKVYDVLGREVATLVNGEMTPGTHEVTWDAGGVPSGVYYYRLQTDRSTDMKKMLLVK